MLQFMLPLVEFGLLIATLFFYWQTRRLLNEARQRATTPAGLAIDSTASVKELTALLAELQAISEAARRDWKNQHKLLGEKIQQAEEKTVTLRELLQQAEENSETCATPAAPARRLDDEITQLKAELLAAGRSPNTTERAVSTAREFCAWLAERQHQEPTLQNVTRREIEQYVSLLKQQNYQPETLKRKKTALSIFIQWLEQRSTVESRNNPDLAVKRLEENKSQLVLTMAHQGLDRQTIAAKAGIEQEAVRLMLMMNTPAYQ
jgi:site-specific recombinase XerD